MAADVQLVALSNRAETVRELAEILVETVANGGSVSFMHPLSAERAQIFWAESLAAADRGERVVIGALADGVLAATVTLDLDCPENQPHRAEIAKLMTRCAFRGQGLARALMHEAERMARARGRTLLNLDTARDEGAAEFYEKLGFNKAGVIPNYALKPHGGLTDTIIYWKTIA